MSAVGKVLSINISSKRGEKKVPIKEAVINKYGIEGDGHSGKWHRQVSILSYERIKEVNKKGINAGPGDFAENLTTQGIDLKKLKIGDTIIIGDKDDIANLSKAYKDNNIIRNSANANKKKIAQLKENNLKFKEDNFKNFNNLEGYKDEVVLEVTQIGKKYTEVSRAYYIPGLPKEGIFCRVLKPGKIKTEDNILAVK